MKKKILPVLVVIALIVVVLACMLISALVKKYSPGDERKDLSEYYNITSEDQVAIVFNREVLETQATLIDGHVYLDYQFVHDMINPTFYWDSNENILFYSTAEHLITVYAESSTYLVTKNAQEFDRTIVKATSDSALIDIDFVKQYSDFTYSYYESPSRVVINNVWGEISVATTKKKTEVRLKGGIKSPILTNLDKKSEVTILDTDEKFTKVMTEDGVIGYVPSKHLSKKKPKTLTCEFTPEEFSSIKKDFEIVMAWHQVTNTAANNDIAAILSETKGVNVISPTWFYLNDNEGNIKDLGSTSYVNYCHQQGIEVWGLVSNLENTEVDSTYVLTHSSTRHNLVNQIISAAIEYNLDGINVDFEALDGTAVGDAYIQFIRELSYKCENNGIVLSVDNYVPTSYTAFYNRREQAKFADYIVIMGYDEHYSGSNEAGSVASIGWVEEGVINTLKEVPADQIILGMPFYTRAWTLTPSEEIDGETIYSVTSKAYGMRAANNLVIDNGAGKVWDEECAQFYAEYQNGDVITKIWLEDAASTEERLKLLDKHSLAGAAFWKLGFETDDIWDIIIKYIN